MSNTNTNRDILMTVDVKTSKVSGGRFSFYITDKNTSNFFVRLVMSMSTNALISNYVTLEKASNYRLELFIIKPDNRLLQIDAELMDEQNALFQFNLTEDCKDMLGKYTCEFWVHSTVNDEDEVITTNSFTYTIKPSISNDLDDIIECDKDYPLLLELITNVTELEEEAKVINENTKLIQQGTQILQEDTRRLQEDTRRLQEAYDNLIDEGVEKYVENFVPKYVEEYVETEIGEELEAINNNISNIINENIVVINKDLDDMSYKIDDIEDKIVDVETEIVKINTKNHKQDMNIKCLFSHTSYSVDAEIVGNDTKLINSKAGTGYINRIEGDTKVNVCNQKYPIPLTMSYTVETGNHVALQGGYDGKAKPYVYGNTLWIDNDTQELIYEFDSERNLRLQSSFEDGYDEESGKYKVDYVSTGKNLFNRLSILEGYEITNVVTGEIALNAELYVSDFIPVEPNKKYISSGKTKGKAYLCYDRNKNFIKGESNFLGTFTIPSECFYIKANGLLSDLETFQLEEGGTATSYEPYKEYTKTLYLNSPLLEGDSIEVSGNDIVHVHRYGKVVLDGSEAIESHATIDKTKMRWRLYRDSTVKNLDNSSLIPLFCDKYAATSASKTWNNEDGICQNTSGNIIFLYLEKYSDGSDESLASLRAELQASPATIVYELASPTYEVISTNDDLYVDSYVNGHLDFDSAVPVDKVEFKCFSTNLTYLKPNTEYIIQFEADNDGIISDIWLGGDFKHNIAVTKGINRIQGTTVASVDDYLNIKGMGANISNIVVTEKLDYDFDYFEGLSSAFESEYDEELGKYKVEYKVYKASFGIQDFEFGKGGRLQ